MPAIRRAAANDLEEIAAIQAACPEAAQWKADSYTLCDIWVAEQENRVMGFVAGRSLGGGEYELLNLAVAPEFRRRGIARELIRTLAKSSVRTIFLEVRQSNSAARELYKSMGFREIGMRDQYYDCPLEAAIVMKFHSC